MKNKIVWTVPKSERKSVEKRKIYTPNTHIHDRSLSLSFIHIITITIKIQQNMSTLNILRTNIQVLLLDRSNEQQFEDIMTICYIRFTEF